jgi:hypothetical protein
MCAVPLPGTCISLTQTIMYSDIVMGTHKEYQDIVDHDIVDQDKVYAKTPEIRTHH